MTTATGTRAVGAPPSSRIDGWVVVALCLAGAVLRLAAYAQNRSLWYDEAALALNIVDRGFVDLLRPLDGLQTAPPLFLWAERVAVLVAGPNEFALRSIPLLAGIALPPLMWRAARRALPSWAALVAVALVAFSPALVRYSAEVKPYVVDALATVVLLDRAIAAASPDARAATWWSLAIAGVVALTASTPVVFVLAGALAYLGVVHLGREGRRDVFRIAGVAAVWALSFLGLLATVFRDVADPAAPTGRFMQWYWSTNFLTTDPPGLRAKISPLLWAATSNTFFGEGAVRGMTTLLVAAMAAGLVGLAVSRRAQLTVLLVTPLLALAVASALRRYPIAERLVLFAAPITALVLASASLIAVRISERFAARAALVGGVVVAALGTMGVIASYRSDEGRQETRTLVRTAMASRADGTPVWVSGGGAPAWRFYSRDRDAAVRDGTSEAGLPGSGVLGSGVLIGAWSEAIPERIVPVVDDTLAAARPSAWSEEEAGRLRSAARPCVLVFLSHVMPGEASALLASAARLGGHATEIQRQPGAELHRVCFESKG